MHEDSASNKNGWVANASSFESFGWNRTRISAVLGGSFWAQQASAGAGPEIMMNVGLWPAALSNSTDSDVLNTTAPYIEAFAKFAASLVTMVNAAPPKGLGLGVRFWAVGNEWDSKSFYAADMGGRAAPPTLAAAKAMRAAEGGEHILVGGPAFARPDLSHQVSSFVNATIGQLDFIDYHSYATGDSGNADSSIWDTAQKSGGVTEGVQHEVDRANEGSLRTGELEVPAAAADAWREVVNALHHRSDAQPMDAAGAAAIRLGGLARELALRVRKRLVLGGASKQLLEQRSQEVAWLSSPQSFWAAALRGDDDDSIGASASERAIDSALETPANLADFRRSRRNAMIRSRKGRSAGTRRRFSASGTWTPLMLHDEINISWAPPDSRMDDSVGAVFDALSVTSAIASGCDSILRWNEADGWYGANNGGPNYERRPPSFARQALVAAYVPGAQNSTEESVIVPSASWPQNGRVVAASATLRGSLSADGRRGGGAGAADGPIAGCGALSKDSQASILLINRGGAEVDVQIQTSWGSDQGAAPSSECPALFVLASQAPASSDGRVGAAWTAAPGAVVAKWGDAQSVLGKMPQDGIAVALLPWTGGETAAKHLLGPDWSVNVQ